MPARPTVLATVAAELYGSLTDAAAALKIAPNTLWRASKGLSVHPETRRKIESAFGLPLEDLAKPLVAALVGEIAGNAS